MKINSKLILLTATTFLLVACGEAPKESKGEAAKNPESTYLDSRIDAIDMAKKSVKKSNKHTKEQDKAMESLINR